MAASDSILYATDGQVARITLNRPGLRNAQSIRMIDEIDQALDRAEADSDVRVVILAGSGPSFSSGHDLKSTRAPDGSVDSYEQEFQLKRDVTETLFEHELDKYVGKCLRLRDFPKPTIAMVQGHCIAAGWMVASMCDLIVAADNAKFSNPVVRMACVGVELPVEFWDVGVRKAKELLFTGEALGAEEALRLGFVNRVAGVDDLETETVELAAKIASMPPVTVRMTKMALNKILDNMGQADSFWQYFLTHSLAHQTQEFHTLKAALGPKKGEEASLKSFLEQRDAKFA